MDARPPETQSDVPVGAGAELLPREVLERVAARDPEALGAFFDAFADRIYALAFRLLGSRELAEDATHDVFLKIHRSAHLLDPGRDPGPWVTTVTVNLCRDFWRSRAYKLGVRSASFEDRPELREILPGASPSPAMEIERTQREEIVQQAIAELPEDMREVVILHDYQGLGHDEIAEIVGASHAAVRKRYSRALGRLAELLEGRL